MAIGPKGRVGLLALLALGVAAVLVFVPVNEHLAKSLDWVQSLGLGGPLLLGAAYILATVLFVPGLILTLGAGFAFGLLVGTVTVSLASTLGALAAFLVARTLARDWIQDKVAGSPRLRALDKAVGQQGFKIVLLARLSPVFPFNLLNYAFGATKISVWDYLLASWVGMLPANVLYVYLGSTLRSLARAAAGEVDRGPGYYVFLALGLLAAVVATVFVTRLARKALREAIPGGTSLPEKPRGSANPG